MFVVKSDSNELDVAKLEWRCRRGTLELDLLVSRFLKRGYPKASARQQHAFRQLLEYPDDVLFDLLTGEVSDPDKDIADVIEQIRYGDFNPP